MKNIVEMTTKSNLSKKRLVFFILFLILNTVPAKADITSNLEGWWKLDDGAGTVAIDSSGNGNTGTFTQAPTWVSGELGGAVSFNGSYNFLSIPSSSSLNTAATANQITVSAWIKVASLQNTWQPIIMMNNWGLILNYNNDIALTTSGAEATNGFPFTADNQWHLITGTFDGTTIRVYEDGALRITYAGGALSNNNQPVLIGAWSQVGQIFVGSIDDVRVYSRALSSDDIVQLYGKTPISLATDHTTYPTVPATVLLTATAYPATGVTIQKVEFYSNNNGTVVDLGAGQAGAVNTSTLNWNNVPTGIYTVTAVVTDSNGVQNTSLPVTIYVNTSQLLYTVNGNGLQSLLYNGQQFVTNPPGSPNAFTNISFQAPDGTQKQYGWGGAHGSSISIYLSGSDCSQVLPANWSTVSPGTNPVCNQNIFGTAGQSDDYTVSTLYTTADPKTLKIDYYITNNDPADTLEQFNMEYFMTLNVPNMTNNQLWEAIGAAWNASPVAFIQGTWGSMALYTDDYTKNTEFWDVWTTTPTTSPVNYLWNFQNYSTPGGDSSNTKTDSIPPGQTYHYAVYISFGSSTDTPASLAPLAFTTFSQEYPYLVNWPDRRPIARWFMAGSQFISNSNPRGWNSTIDLSNQQNFNSSILSWTNSIINYMNSLNPRPQGIVVWDLEGEEFYQPFTYVGNPPQLAALAPEMNAAADQVFAALKAAGYQVGMTLRPSNFQTGTALPSTCNYNASIPVLSDVFILTTPTGPTQYGGYVCTAPNTWTQPGYRQPANQTISDIDSIILGWLEAKVTYAHNRWGARIFYVDSTVYATGPDLNFNIFRQLQLAFPDCLFLPENTNNYFLGASSRYGDTGWYGDTAAPSVSADIWPKAFSVIESFDVDIANDNSSSSYYTPLVAGVSSGSILFLDGWYGPSAQNNDVEQIYQAANIPTLNTLGYGLTVASTGAGSGNITGTVSITTNGVTTNTQEINCPSANCIAAFDGGTSVALTAVPSSGSIFNGWSGGGCNDSGPTCVVTMNSNQTVTANFIPASTTYLISFSTSGVGFGEVFANSIDLCGVNGGSCVETVNAGISMTLAATATGDSVFSSWTITGSAPGTCVGTISPCTITVTANTNVTANFNHTILVGKLPNNKIIISAPPNNGINFSMAADAPVKAMPSVLKVSAIASVKNNDDTLMDEVNSSEDNEADVSTNMDTN